MIFENIRLSSFGYFFIKIIIELTQYFQCFISRTELFFNRQDLLCRSLLTAHNFSVQLRLHPFAYCYDTAKKLLHTRQKLILNSIYPRSYLINRYIAYIYLNHMFLRRTQYILLLPIVYTKLKAPKSAIRSS